MLLNLLICPCKWIATTDTYKNSARQARHSEHGQVIAPPQPELEGDMRGIWILLAPQARQRRADCGSSGRDWHFKGEKKSCPSWRKAVWWLRETWAIWRTLMRPQTQEACSWVAGIRAQREKAHVTSLQSWTATEREDQRGGCLDALQERRDPHTESCAQHRVDSNGGPPRQFC